MPNATLSGCSTYLNSRSCVVDLQSYRWRRPDRERKIVEARLAAGGVAPLPWRLDRTEAALVGRALDAQTIAAAGDMAVEHARPLADNSFKIALLRNAVIRALQTLGSQP